MPLPLEVCVRLLVAIVRLSRTYLVRYPGRSWEFATAFRRKACYILPQAGSFGKSSLRYQSPQQLRSHSHVVVLLPPWPVLVAAQLFAKRARRDGAEMQTVMYFNFSCVAYRVSLVVRLYLIQLVVGWNPCNGFDS